MRRYALLFVLAGAIVGGVDRSISAQGSTALTAQSALAFEVVSVKPSTTTGQMSFRSSPGGHFRAVNVPLEMLINHAYNIRREGQITGIPSWVRTEHFDVDATAPSVPGRMFTVPDVQAMLRRLLEDRFRLIIAPASSTGRAYSLTTARADGTLGTSLRESRLDCAAMLRPTRSPVAPPRVGSFPSECGTWLDRAKGTFAAGGVSSEAIAAALSATLGIPVLNQTRLDKRYDVALAWEPEPTALRSGQPTSDSNRADAMRASIFTAVQEQLGLKLNMTQTAGDTYVITHVERPSEN